MKTTTTAMLLDYTKDIWQKYYTHPFVTSIEKGTLDKSKFKFYIMQDFLYLMDYTKVFAIGIAKTDNIELGKMFSTSVSNILDGELDIHNGYMSKLNITQVELDNLDMNIDNLSYTSYMLRIAYEQGSVEILTSILACSYSYELIAKNILKNTPESINNEFYGNWITEYSSDEYSQWNVLLLDTLDKLTEDYSEKQLKNLKQIFKACSIYELKFWDMAWEMK